MITASEERRAKEEEVCRTSDAPNNMKQTRSTTLPLDSQEQKPNQQLHPITIEDEELLPAPLPNTSLPCITMPRQKEMKVKKKIRGTHLQKSMPEDEYGEISKALTPEFDDALESPKKRKKKSNHQITISKNALVKANRPTTKKKQAGPSRRGNFGKLPTSGGAENIGVNSPGNALLGKGVKKIFNDEDTGKPRLFYGLVTAYNAKHELYKVSYEDGDEEEVTPAELESILATRSFESVRGGTKKMMKKKRSKTKKVHSILENV